MNYPENDNVKSNQSLVMGEEEKQDEQQSFDLSKIGKRKKFEL